MGIFGEGGAYALAANGGRHWVQVFAPLWTGFRIRMLPVVVTRAFWRRASGRESSTRRKPVVFSLDLVPLWVYPESENAVVEVIYAILADLVC